MEATETITTTKLIIIILSSSVIASILTSFANYFLTQINYKNEYFKKIIDKRLLAFEEVYEFIVQFKVLIHDDDKVSPFFFGQGVVDAEAKMIMFFESTKNSFWLSKEVGELITEFNVLIHNIITKAKIEKDKDAALKNLGMKHLDDLRKTRKKIEVQLFKDLQKLHKVENLFSKDLIK
ncbi:MAG: hypothetical protein RJA07_1872 [Bacteroidota bacterium]|jgi:Na+-transporting NADH:ubiquinone oxidoreductase subunit NqrC